MITFPSKVVSIHMSSHESVIRWNRSYVNTFATSYRIYSRLSRSTYKSNCKFSVKILVQNWGLAYKSNWFLVELDLNKIMQNLFKNDLNNINLLNQLHFNITFKLLFFIKIFVGNKLTMKWHYKHVNSDNRKN